MQPVTGIFSSYAKAERAVAELDSRGIPQERVNFLAPAASQERIHEVPTTDTEQPGMGKAVGGVVGAAVGTAGGAHLGMAAASVLVPGVGPTIAIGLAAAALLGIGGAVGGAVAGEKLEQASIDGLPKDEIFVYRDALRRGRAVVIVLARDDNEAERVRTTFREHDAESIDAAREQWWVGLRDEERAQYGGGARAFDRDELIYREGFEAALREATRGRPYASAVDDLETNYPEHYREPAFRRGYEGGRLYLQRWQERET